MTGTQLETERRFLLKKIPTKESQFKTTTYDKVYDIIQHYLSEVDDKTTKRVRFRSSLDGGLEYFYTEKTSVSKMSCEEFEKQITSNEYIELVKESLRKLKKKRYIYKDGDLNWEIDQMEMGPDYTSLIIAEIELPSEDYELEIPEFIKKEILLEITGIKEFSNNRLSQ